MSRVHKSQNLCTLEVIIVVKLIQGYVYLMSCAANFLPSRVYLTPLFQDQRTHFALAFELPGGWHKEKEAMTLTVLQV